MQTKTLLMIPKLKYLSLESKVKFLTLISNWMWVVRNYLLTSFKVNCFFPVTTGSLPVLIVFTRALHLRRFSPDITCRLLQNNLHYGNYFICFKSYSFDILNYLCCWKSLKNIAESKNFELNAMVCDPAVFFII